MVTLGLLALITITAFVTDAKYNKIPNRLIVVGIILGLSYHLIANGWKGILYSAAGMLVGFVVLLLLYIMKALGAGDVKLFAAIGAISGTEFVLYGAMYSVLYAGLIGLVIVIARGELMKRIRNVVYPLFGLYVFRNLKQITVLNKDDCMQFPFMYAVLPGVATTILYVQS